MCRSRSASSFAFAVALTIGFLNGLIVVRTHLPSFIVTLASLYILRGLMLALSILFTNRTIVGGVKEVAEGTFVGFLFSGTIGDSFFAWLADHDVIGRLPNGAPSVKGVPMLIVWALAIAFVGHIVLTKTKAGNWIFASGGDAYAARSVGVPVARVKIALFMLTAFCACVFAACQVMEFGSAASDRGLLKEFEAIIAAVIGGCLLTGGYGSVIGACCGALIYGVVQQGIEFMQAPNRLVPRLSRRHAPDCGLVQQSHPPPHHEREVTVTPSSDRDGSAATSAGAEPPLIEVRNLVKHFGPVVALAGVSLTVRAGEVHCLVGDNGAGKSTLIKTLSGVYRPTGGDFLFEGKPVQLLKPARSARSRHRHGFSGPRDDPAPVDHAQFLHGPRAGEEQAWAVLVHGHGACRQDRARGHAAHWHRRARSSTAGRHALRRRAPVRRDRAGRPLRRQGA